MDSKISRRNLLRTAGIVLGAAGLGATSGKHTSSDIEKTGDINSSPSRPNIIFILADDLGYGDLGCYGQKTIRTPNIDRLAQEGIRFTQCYAGSTVCAPSRCALMTGYHTGHSWIRGNKRVPLREEDVTVASVLKKAGYRTGLIGKWGLGEPDTTGIPNRQGFDYFFGYLNQGNAHNYYPEFLWRNEEKIPLKGNREYPDHPRVSIERTTYSHDLFIKESLDFIQREKDNPFFLYLALTIPHANDERGHYLGDGMEVPDYGPYADRPWPTPEKGYAAMIDRMDKDIGRLIEHLDKLGLRENTLVFFTSDNGPHKEGGADPAFFDSAGPLRGYKRDLYEGGIRIPMIACWPEQIPAGVTSDFPWAFWDFLPTAAALAHTKAPEGIDGINVLPALRGEKNLPGHDYLYWEFYERGFAQAARRGDWKVVRTHPDAPLELYNLAQDIREQDNQAAHHPEILKEMETVLLEAHTDNPFWKKPV